MPEFAFDVVVQTVMRVSGEDRRDAWNKVKALDSVDPATLVDPLGQVRLMELTPLPFRVIPIGPQVREYNPLQGKPFEIDGQEVDHE